MVSNVATLLWKIQAESSEQLSEDAPHERGLGCICSYSGWSETSEKGNEAEVIQYMRGNQNALWAYDFRWVCIFIGRYSYFAILFLDWINNPHRLSWRLAPHFCPCLPVPSPERPGLRHLGDKLPISPVEHLWGWALSQNSSSTWGGKEWRKLNRRKEPHDRSTPVAIVSSPLHMMNTAGKTLYIQYQCWTSPNVGQSCVTYLYRWGTIRSILFGDIQRD